MARLRQKVVWSNPAAAQAAATRVLPQHLGNFPAISNFWYDDKRDEGKVRAELTHGCLVYIRAATLLTHVWDGTDAEVNQVGYLSKYTYNPSGKAVVEYISDLTPAIYVGDERLTEWCNGWARPSRPIFLLNGLRVAPLQSKLIILVDEIGPGGGLKRPKS